MFSIAPQKFKLQHHQTHDVRGIVGSKEHTVIEFDQPDVLLSSRGTHGISAGDVIEVYHPEDPHHALFLVPYLRDDVQLRDVISIEHSIAQTFKLQPHKIVCVQVVDKESVTLDLVELYIRDQYFSRSDSYRFIQQLIGGVLQVNKKIGYNQMRVQVGELWRKGEKYSSGYVGPETKIVFRSSTAVMQIFIQLSKEMWLFDEHGDLYFERTLKFLSELFLKFWPESNSNHDGSIVFFTRVFLDDLPLIYQKRANCNAEGRFFEDFYRVIVQNERFTLEEWKRVLTQLKLEFKVFLREITTYLSIRYPVCDGAGELTTYVSCAPDGNFLEALNMAMNLYASYNIDRSFEHTGKLAFVITPGIGCFRVEDKLLNLTKQRVLDRGVGMDLICLGPQPLHSVPLFKIVNTHEDDYVVPYWINCSFYRSAQEMRRINLGYPVNRVQVVPVTVKSTDVGQMATTWRCSEDITYTNMESHQHVKRHPLPVHRILYPSYSNSFQAERLGLSNHVDQLASRSSDDDDAHGLQHGLLQKQRYSARGIPNAVMAAISTARVVAKANRATRRPTHSSESDISSVGELNWDETLHRFSTVLSRSDHLNTESGKPINWKTCSQPMRANSVHHRTMATVASLPSVREHQVELISSGPTQNIPQMQLTDPIVTEVHGRNDSFCSDADGSVSTASSVDSGANRDLPSQKICHSTFRSHANLWHCQRPLSLTGPECHKNQYLKHFSGSLLSHVTPLGQTHRRGSLSQSTQSGCVSVVRPSLTTANYRQRTLSTFYPGRFQKGCEFTGNASFLAVTAGRRRWIFVRPHDEHGNPIVTHRILSGSSSWDFVNRLEVANSLCSVWVAYFNFLRARLNHSAPGGPAVPSDNLILAGFDSARCPSVSVNSASGAPTDRDWPTGACAGRILPKPIPKSNGLPPGFEASSATCLPDVQRLLRCVENFNNRTPSLAHFTFDCKMDDSTTAFLKNTLQLVGVDWKSVSTPATLPVHTDFFPDNASLKSETYVLHDYRVVVTGLPAHEWESTLDFVRDPGLLYCRRQLTVREVFYEMLLQRLSHGFQLCEKPPCLPTSSSSTGLDHHCASTVGSPGSTLLCTIGNGTASASLSPPGTMRPSANKSTPRLSLEQRVSRTSGNSNSYFARKQLQQQQTSFDPSRSTSRRKQTRNSPNLPTSLLNVNNPRGGQLTNATVRIVGIGLIPSAPPRTSVPLSRSANRSGPRTQSVTPPTHDKLLFPHKTCFKLSVGRLFHSISLEEDSITLTSYRPRIEDDPISLEYKYSLRVPDALSYHLRQTVFSNNAITVLNWSYLDNYVCARGVSDSYVLNPSLKFWRSRFMLVPIYTNETKRLSDAIKESLNNNGSRVLCDVYESDYGSLDRKKFCEKFLSFLEIVNRVRRVPTSSSKMSRQPHASSPLKSPIASVGACSRMGKLLELGPAPYSGTVCKFSFEPNVLMQYGYKWPIVGNLGNDPISFQTDTSLNASCHLDHASKFEVVPNVKHTKPLCQFRRHTSVLPDAAWHEVDSSTKPTCLNASTAAAPINTPKISTIRVTSDISTSSQWARTRSASILYLSQVVKSNVSVKSKQEISGVNKPKQLGSNSPSFTSSVGSTVMTQRSSNPSQAVTVSTEAFPLVEESLNTTSNSAGSITLSSDAIVGPVGSTFTHVSTIVEPFMSSANTPFHYVAFAMTDPHNGLAFVSNVNTAVLPDRTFLAFDATIWVINHFADVHTIDQAVGYLQTLLKAGWIRHTSGNPNHAFVFGFHFYTLLTDAKSSSIEVPTALVDGSEYMVHSTPVTPLPFASAGVANVASQSSSNLAVTYPLLIGPLTKPVDASINVKPVSFPEAFIPKATPGPSGWTVDFQTEWAEVAFAYSAYEPCCSTTGFKPMETSSYGKSSTQQNPSVNPRNGFLTYENISTICGVPGKVGYHNSDSTLQKSCVCDLDDPATEGRVEWAHCVYDANYHPRCAFSLELQWLVASGTKLSELISNWHCRACKFEFHLFPVPCFPFGHATMRSDTDPLRAPIFVSINVRSLLSCVTNIPASNTGTRCTWMDRGSTSSGLPGKPITTHYDSDRNPVDVAARLFPGYTSVQQLYLLRLFQEHLVFKFGFLCERHDDQRAASAGLSVESILNTPDLPKPRIYVHCSGGMFIMVPVYRNGVVTPTLEKRSPSSPAMLSSTLSSSGQTLQDTVSTLLLASQSPLEMDRASDAATPHPSRYTTVTREMANEDTEYRNSCFASQVDIGYFWSWNHMLPRRWRGYLTGDESFQDAVLADFRAFMNAEDSRLMCAFQAFVHNLSPIDKSEGTASRSPPSVQVLSNKSDRHKSGQN